jgi:hypothetical protein
MYLDTLEQVPGDDVEEIVDEFPTRSFLVSGSNLLTY